MRAPARWRTCRRSNWNTGCVKSCSSDFLKFVPGSGAIANRPGDAAEAFVVVELEVTVHGNSFGDAGAGKVVIVAAAAVEGEVRIRRVECAGERRVS